MAKWSKTLLLLVLAAGLLLAVIPVGAQAPPPSGPPPAAPPLSKPYPMGQVTMTFTEVGAGVGFQKGEGVLTYEGKQYTFKVTGMKLGAVGISKAVVEGDVYNLFSIGEFPGRYQGAGSGLAIFKGKEGQAFRNSKGVHILLRSQEKGVKLNIGPEGFTIRLQEAL